MRSRSASEPISTAHRPPIMATAPTLSTRRRATSVLGRSERIGTQAAATATGSRPANAGIIEAARP